MKLFVFALALIATVAHGADAPTSVFGLDLNTKVPVCNSVPMWAAAEPKQVKCVERDQDDRMVVIFGEVVRMPVPNYNQKVYVKRFNDSIVWVKLEANNLDLRNVAVAKYGKPHYEKEGGTALHWDWPTVHLRATSGNLTVWSKAVFYADKAQQDRESAALLKKEAQSNRKNIDSILSTLK